MSARLEIDGWAVLRHNEGGRLFHIGEICTPDERGFFLVGEKREGPWAKQPVFYVRSEQLVPASSKEEARRLVQALTALHVDLRKSTEALKAQFHRDCEAACLAFQAPLGARA